MTDKRVLVVGVGNPILGDDSVGWVVAQKVREQLDNPLVEVKCLSVGGLTLMEHLAGYDGVIIIDAVYTGEQPPGSLSHFPLSHLPNPTAGHTTSAHDTSLLTAIQVGRLMGVELPQNIQVVGIESQRIYEFTEQLTPEVAQAVPRATHLVQELLEQITGKEAKL